MPYTIKDESQKGPQPSAGLLHVGRVVYLSADPQSTEEDQEIPAYVEGVGVLLLNSRWIKRLN
jgi:hypothetical protein